MKTDSFTDLCIPESPTVETNELIIPLSSRHERDLFMLKIALIGDTYYLFRHVTDKFSEAYAMCDDGLMIGQGEVMFYVLKKVG